MALLCMDLDRFKFINDTLGHHAGDALLVQYARRVEGLLREMLEREAQGELLRAG